MKKRSLALLALAASLSLAGCESKQAATSAHAANAQDDGSEKLTINLMVSSNQGGGWPNNNPVLLALDKKLNIDLKIHWIPADDYKDKLNVLAASGKFPDVYEVGDTSLYQKWQAKNIFLDFTPYLAQYPNFTKYLGADAMEILNPKGKVYGLPKYVPEFRDNLAIRQDWLDKLHLKAPTTVDEFYETAKAFVNDDPDGDGKKDTVGFSFALNQNGNFNNLDYLMGAFGLGNQWKLVDGKLVPYQLQTKELTDFIGFLRKAYSEGVLDKDFAVNKIRDPLDKFEANKSGINYVNANQLQMVTMAALKKVAPDAQVVQLTPPKGPTGLQATITTVSLGKIVVNNKIDAKKQQRIVKLLDYMLSDEGFDLIKNGVEGIHYKKVGDDKYEKLPAFDQDRPYLLSTWFFRRFDPNIQIRKWDDQEYAKSVFQWFENGSKYKWPNPAVGLKSDTTVKLGTQLNQEWLTTMVNIIVGKEPLDNIEKAAEAWSSGGGDQIVKEINDQYVLTQS